MKTDAVRSISPGRARPRDFVTLLFAQATMTLAETCTLVANGFTLYQLEELNE